MKIIATPNELIDQGLWEKYCEETGTNPYAVNEGLISGNENIEWDRKKKKMEKSFAEKVSEIGNKELVTTYQYVSGLFARQQEQMNPKLKKTAKDMKIKMLHR